MIYCSGTYRKKESLCAFEGGGGDVTACIGYCLFSELTLSEDKTCCFESMHLFACICVWRRMIDDLVKATAETLYTFTLNHKTSTLTSSFYGHVMDIRKEMFLIILTNTMARTQ